MNTEGIDKQTKEGVKQKGKKGIEQQGKEGTGQQGKGSTEQQAKERAGQQGKEGTGQQGKGGTEQQGKEKTGQQGKGGTEQQGKEKTRQQGKEGTEQQGKYGIGQQGKGGTEQQGKQAKDADDNATKKQMSKFDENNQLNSEIEDPLLLSYKKKIDDEAKVVEKEVEAKRLSEIFEFDNNDQLNENVPGVNMSFLDRLLHQLTRPRDPVNSYNYPSDDEYTEIDHREVTAVTNDNIIESSYNENKMKNNIPLKESLQTFIEELIEETDVIRGSIDEETLFNRRSRIAKSSLPMIKKNQIEINGTSK